MARKASQVSGVAAEARRVSIRQRGGQNVSGRKNRKYKDPEAGRSLAHLGTEERPVVEMGRRGDSWDWKGEVTQGLVGHGELRLGLKSKEGDLFKGTCW